MNMMVIRDVVRSIRDVVNTRRDAVILLHHALALHMLPMTAVIHHLIASIVLITAPSAVLLFQRASLFLFHQVLIPQLILASIRTVAVINTRLFVSISPLLLNVLLNKNILDVINTDKSRMYLLLNNSKV